MAIPVFETERLILRPLKTEDAQQIQRLFPQWEIVRYLAARFPWPYPENGAEEFVNQVVLPAMAGGKDWFWTICRKENPQQLIGVISLSLTPDNHRGFWLDPAWHRCGYMTEACRVVTEYWFTVLDQDVLRVPKARDNAASRQMSLSSGMRLIRTGTEQYIGGEMTSELWEITRQEWLTQTRDIVGNG